MKNLFNKMKQHVYMGSFALSVVAMFILKGSIGDKEIPEELK